MKQKRIFNFILAYGLMLIGMLCSALIYLIIFDKGNLWQRLIYIGVFLALLSFVCALDVYHTRKKLSLNEMYLLCATIFFAYSVSIFASQINLYAVPTFLTAFLLTPLVKRKDSFLGNFFCVVMVVSTLLTSSKTIYSLNEATKILNLLLSGIFCGTICVFFVSYQRRRMDFILKGGAICLICVFVLLGLSTLSMWIEDKIQLKSLIEVATLTLLASFSQLVLSILLQPLSEKLFNLLTNLRLQEMTDHHSPLIKRLIEEAPGTFNHCLAVANYAEVCATAIGENPYFARACAYYHDIGKLNNPQFFKENQAEINHHDDLLPEVSAQIIKNHTTDGFKLCQKNKIPLSLAKITIEHHGTMPISVFYSKAKELTDGVVDVKEYSYGGELPSSKTSAIIMICDSAEAAIRSMDSPDANKAEGLISALIASRISSGQFNDCDITLKELNTIKETIVMAFGGVFHKRIQYPSEDKQ